MAFDFTSLNRQSTVREGIDTSEMEFRPLKEFCGQTIRCDGFFFTDGRYGRQTVVVGNGYLINMPKRSTEQFEAIQADKDALSAVLDGKLIINGIKMIDTKNGTTAGYTLANG